MKSFITREDRSPNLWYPKDPCRYYRKTFGPNIGYSSRLRGSGVEGPKPNQHICEVAPSKEADLVPRS